MTPIASPVAPAAAKSPKELVADLGASEASVRAAAAEALGKTKPAEALVPLAEAFKKEADTAPRTALADALAAFDPAQVARQPALADAATKGTDDQKRALIALFKKAGSEPGVKFLVDQFVAKGEMALRNEVCSALKKHKKLAVKPLIECFGRSGSKPDIQADIIKYLGILAETGRGAAFLVSLFEPDGTRNTAINAILGIDRPAVPALIAGLGGPNHTRLYAALVLRTLTGQMLTSQKVAEWNQWWVINRKTVEAEQAKQERADEADDWRVTDADWTGFDSPVEMGTLTIYRPRGRAGRGGGESPMRRREE
jgi:HEAT repeat protein